MPLDFSLLGQGPQVANALAMASQGRQDRQQSNVRNALAAHKDDPSLAAPELIANGEVEMGTRLEDRGIKQRQTAERSRLLGQYGTDPTAARTGALATGDAELINQISTMDANQRAVAAKNADDLASVGFALKNLPIDQRKATLQSPQMTEFLASKGFKPEMIAAFDPTDANLDGIIAQGTSLKDMLAQAREDRTVKFQDRQQTETERANRERENIGRTNAGANAARANKPSATSTKRQAHEMTDAELLALAGVK